MPRPQRMIKVLKNKYNIEANTIVHGLIIKKDTIANLKILGIKIHASCRYLLEDIIEINAHEYCEKKTKELEQKNALEEKKKKK